MAKLIFGMNLSLDGYVDHDAFAPDPVLFRHWTEHVRGLSGSVYGRRMYEVMRYWDDDRPEWGPDERDFAAAWRNMPKWVVSRTLTSAGPNATLVAEDPEAPVRGLKARRWRTAWRGWSTNTGSICIPSCWGRAGPSSPAPARPCA